MGWVAVVVVVVVVGCTSRQVRKKTEDDTKDKRHSACTKSKKIFLAPKSIKFGSGKVYLEPERYIWNRKGTKKPQNKN